MLNPRVFIEKSYTPVFDKNAMKFISLMDVGSGSSSLPVEGRMSLLPSAHARVLASHA